LVSIGFGELQKRLKSAEHYAEQWKWKKPKALILQGFWLFGV